MQCHQRDDKTMFESAEGLKALEFQKAILAVFKEFIAKLAD